jgi:hypothetical protein
MDKETKEYLDSIRVILDDILQQLKYISTDTSAILEKLKQKGQGV